MHAAIVSSPALPRATARTQSTVVAATALPTAVAASLTAFKQRCWSRLVAASAVALMARARTVPRMTGRRDIGRCYTGAGRCATDTGFARRHPPAESTIGD